MNNNNNTSNTHTHTHTGWAQQTTARSVDLLQHVCMYAHHQPAYSEYYSEYYYSE